MTLTEKVCPACKCAMRVRLIPTAVGASEGEPLVSAERLKPIEQLECPECGHQEGRHAKE